MWSWWMWVASTASTCVTANGSNTMGAARRFGCVARPPVMFRIWWNGAISLVFWVRFPLPNHRSVAMFAPLWVLSQMPVQPIHHMLNVPGATCGRVDLLVEPGAPFGESSQNPLLACDVVDHAHGRVSLFAGSGLARLQMESSDTPLVSLANRYAMPPTTSRTANRVKAGGMESSVTFAPKNEPSSAGPKTFAVAPMP